MAGETLSIDVRLARGRPTFELTANATINPGISVVYGPSGAGKSTLLQLVAGLLRPDAGAIRLGTETLFERGRVDVPPERRRVSFVMQSPALFPHLDVRGNVEFGLRHLPREERDARVARWLGELGARELVARRVQELSGGEAQRVSLARALAPSPRILLLDEPFSALDHATRDVLVERVRSAVSAASIPALYVTHDANEARAAADRALLMEHGRIVATCDTEDISR